MITKIIQDIKTITGLDVTVEKSTKKQECIIYSLSKESDNGAVCQYRLTINIVTKTTKKAIEFKSLIDNLLITKGDEQKYDEILSCSLNGGGTLYDKDTDMYENISYYDFISKSKIDWR